MPGFRSFAIIPAAGRSRRMGVCKLTLSLDGAPLIDHVLRAWVGSRVDSVVVVVRASDQRVLERCSTFDIQVVATSEDPPSMRDSLEIGLRHVEQTWRPSPEDVWLAAPADIPGLESSLIDRLLSEFNPLSPRVIVPLAGGRNAHPALLPWSCVEQFRGSPNDQGLNTYVRASQPQAIEFSNLGLLRDIDTPDDYRRLNADRHPL